MKETLKNVGHSSIIEELIPSDEQRPVPYEEIRRNVEKSDFVFLFLTDNVVATPSTQNWVSYEIGLASANSKKLFVFERIGTPVEFPIPYLTGYALFNPDKAEDILALQSLAKGLGKFNRSILAAGGGAVVGSVLGPIGMVVGGVLGYLVWPKDPKHPTAKCDHCNVRFTYYSTHKTFRCPSCRLDINLE